MMRGIHVKIDLVIIIVTYNSDKDIEHCIYSIDQFLSHSPLVWRAIVVDNQSTDQTVSILKQLANQFSWIELSLQNTNLGFGVANNIGFKTVDADYYCLINADAWLVTDTLTDSIIQLKLKPQVAVCGLPLVFPDGNPQTYAYAHSSWKKWLLHLIGMRTIILQLLRFNFVTCYLKQTHTGREFVKSQKNKKVDLSNISDIKPTYKTRAADWVCGAAMIINNQFILQSGGFDPNIFLYGEDEDLCISARQCGFEVVAIDAPPVVHAFGWGNNKFNRKVADLKYNSLKYFIKKNIHGKVSRTLMNLMLPFHVYGVKYFYYCWFAQTVTDNNKGH